MRFGYLGLQVVYFSFYLRTLDLEESRFGADGFEMLVDHFVLADHLRQLNLVVRCDRLGCN